MATISYFTVPKKEKDAGPGILLWLASYTGDRDGDILLSRRLTTGADIDRCVDRLIGQLERVRLQAKHELRRAREEVRRPQDREQSLSFSGR
jgi:hypothetical protein